jgi:hypothetical protein
MVASKSGCVNRVATIIFHAARIWHFSACCETSNLVVASMRATFSISSFFDMLNDSSSDESDFLCFDREMRLLFFLQ